MSNVKVIAEQLKIANDAGDFSLLKEPLSVEDRLVLAPQIAKNFDAYLANLESGKADSFTLPVLASTYSADNAEDYVDRLASAFAKTSSLQTLVFAHDMRDNGMTVAIFSDADVAKLFKSMPAKVTRLEVRQVSNSDVNSLAESLKDKLEIKQLDLWFEKKFNTKVASDVFSKLLFGLKLSKIDKFGVVAPGQGDNHPLFAENTWSAKGTKIVFNPENEALKAFCQAMDARPVFDKNMGSFSFTLGSAVQERNAKLPDFSGELKRFLCGKDVEANARGKRKAIIKELRAKNSTYAN